MKITIVKKTETKVEVEITLPYYLKCGSAFYKVVNDSEWGALKVSYPTESCCLIHNCTTSEAINSKGEQSTESEFTTALEQAVDYLNNLNSTK